MEITAEILCLRTKPQTKTLITYGTNLSWKMLQQYLGYMQEHELLETKDKTKYATSQRGREFIQKWNELKELIESTNTPKI
ncbi:MAG: winged helix-turn-helix domain-containing protein [archaeon]|nr:winged helix-turn-helix domain-containing protein [Candidatus Bathyarchaeum sp.]